jgi:uncharacterized protein with von Willebrand factor type A (vWA) domain
MPVTIRWLVAGDSCAARLSKLSQRRSKCTQRSEWIDLRAKLPRYLKNDGIFALLRRSEGTAETA